MFYRAGVSVKTRRTILERADELKNEKLIFKQLVCDIIRIRNRILNAQKDFHTRNCVNNSWFESVDYGKLYKYITPLSKLPENSSMKVWSIKTRLNSDISGYESDCITDDDS